MAPVFLLVRALVTPVLACPGVEATGEDSGAATEVAAAHIAHHAQLVGANCAYSTGLMASRVLREGAAWSWSGRLVGTANNLESRVASPYRAESDGAVVIATEILEALVSSGGSTRPIVLEGRVLEVDGVRYAVVTSYRVINS